MFSFNNDLARKSRSAAARLPLLSALALTVAAPTAAEPWSPAWLTLSGDHRIRYSSLDNQFRPDLAGSDQAVTLRTRLMAEINVGHLAFVGELQDSRGYLMDEGSAITDSIINAVELLQGYVGLGAEDVITQGDTLDLKFGRWTKDLGRRRLMARQRFRNNSNNYTGVSAEWTGTDKSELFAFWSLPVNRLPSDKQALLDNEIEFDDEDFDLQFWGINYKRPDVFLGGSAEAYLFGLIENDDPDQQRTRDRHLFTPGILLYKKPEAGQWDFDIENTLQFGTSRGSSSPTDTKDLDVFAHFHHLELGYTFAVPWSPRIGAEFDYASGDSNPNDGKQGRFDTLFGARVREFGPTGLWGLLARENIIQPGLRFEVEPNARTDARLVYRAAFLAEKSDAYPGDGGIQDPTGQSGSFLGHEIFGRVRYWIVPKSVRFTVGGAYFIEDEFLEDAPNANPNGNPIYGYTDISFIF